MLKLPLIFQFMGNTVREYRTDMGLSQEKLAEILNLDQRTILNIELLALFNDCTEQEASALLSS